MKIKHLLICLLLITATKASAQRWPFELWHDGKIILTTGDTLKGLVKYDLAQDLVQFDKSNERPEAFSARKVLLFEIFDNTVHKYRTFFALPYSSSTTGYKTPSFFELLEEGKMTLLSREGLEYRSYSTAYASPYPGQYYSRPVLVYTFYFLEENGEVVAFTGNKNDLLDKMGKKSETVEKYIKANRLKFDDKYDLAKIVAYYNSLMQG